MLLGDDKLGNSVNDHLFSLVYVLVKKNPEDFDYIFTFVSKREETLW